MTHYFFDAGVFLSNFWASNTLSAGVEVPAPVQPVPVGGGGGVWPAWRIKAKLDRACDDFVKEIARKYCPDPEESKKKFVPYPKHLESLKKKVVKGKEFEEKGKIRSLQKRIEALEEHLKRLKEAAFDKKREREERLRAARRMERLGRRVRALLSRLESLFRRLEAREAEVARREAEVARKEARLQEEFNRLAQVPETIPFDPELERLKLIIMERRRVIAGVKAAIPWAAGSVAVYLGTEYLIPEEKRFLRFLGYAASGALVVTALAQGFTVYNDWEGTAAARG